MKKRHIKYQRSEMKSVNGAESDGSTKLEIVPMVGVDYLYDSSESTSSLLTSIQQKSDILEALRNINKRLDQIEQNQATIIHNQSILSQGQATLVRNQEKIYDKLKHNMSKKPKNTGQHKTIEECTVDIKNFEEVFCHVNADVTKFSVNEFDKLLPLQTLEKLKEVEERLHTPEFAEAMISYLNSLKGRSEDVSSIIREIFTDELLDKYNWDGRWNKQSLGKLYLFNKILRDVFNQQTAFNFEKSVRKAVERSHHRFKQSQYIIRKEKGLFSF